LRLIQISLSGFNFSTCQMAICILHRLPLNYMRTWFQNQKKKGKSYQLHGTCREWGHPPMDETTTQSQSTGAPLIQKAGAPMPSGSRTAWERILSMISDVRRGWATGCFERELSKDKKSVPPLRRKTLAALYSLLLPAKNSPQLQSTR